ncbi:calcium-binding protein [Alysiella crassa]|nr:calcium-binding protein [Alysiella crassa]
MPSPPSNEDTPTPSQTPPSSDGGSPIPPDGLPPSSDGAPLPPDGSPSPTPTKYPNPADYPGGRIPMPWEDPNHPRYPQMPRIKLPFPMPTAKKPTHHDDGSQCVPVALPWVRPNGPKYHIVDPLVLDLDGNGIQAVAANGFSGSLFDFNGDGIRTATAWFAKGDGLLVRDLNGNGTIDNGTEIFGDETRLKNGEKAAHGFEALADLDSNQDGKVDATDEAFGSLKVWKDDNQDGVSQADELHGLDTLGIAALNVAYKDVNEDLGNKNRLAQLGSYDKADGSQGKMGDLLFDTNPLYSQFKDRVEMTLAQFLSANVQGMGRVRDLNQAAVGSETLAAVVKEYSAAETKSAQFGLLDKLLVEWAKTDNRFGTYEIAFSSAWVQTQNEGIGLTPTQAAQIINQSVKVSDETKQALEVSREKIAVLDALTGMDSQKLYITGNDDAKKVVDLANKTYADVSASVYQTLLFQTRLKPYVAEIALRLEEGNQLVWDFSALQAAFEQVHASNPQKALVDLGEFLAYGNVPTWYAGRTLMKRYVDEARSAGTLDSLLAELGKDTVALLSKTHGDKENNVLQNVGLQNSSYTYLSGNDGDDVLIASAGENSHLSGGYGSDVYVLGRDFKSVSISNGSRNQDDVDTIYFTDGIKQADLTFTRNSNNLLIQTKEGDNQVTVSNFFYADDYQINRIIFEDGTTLTVDNIKEMVQQSTDGRDNLYAYDSGSLISAGAGDDYLYGAKGNDTLNGDDGNDYLYGRAGDDVLNGGAGNDNLSGEDGDDTLNGGAGSDGLNGGQGHDTLNGGEGNDSLNAGDGSDVYVFAKNFGQDTIYNYDKSANRVDTIQFTDGIKQTDLTFTRSNDNLLIKTKEGDNQITVSNFFYADDYQIDRITFEDGTVLDVAAIKEMVQQGTDERDNLYAYDSGSLISAGAGNDYLYGAKGNDTLNGDDGSDQIYGRAGDDVLNGGAGNDSLQGDAGNDTLNGGEGNDSLNAGDGSDVYVFAKNFGQDTIYNYDKSANRVDTIQFTDGIKQTDLTFTRNGDNLLIKTKEGENQVTVSNFFYADDYQIDRITFEDGTVLDVAAIKEIVQQGTDSRDNLYAYDSGSLISAGAGNDYLYGAKGNDTLNGDDGNDYLYGRAGDDVLNGGAGNDNLQGDAGNDTLNGGEGNDSLNAGDGSDVYVFAKNFGQDTIYNYDKSANRVDTIQFTDGIKQADLTFTRNGDNLLIKTKEGENQVTVSNFFYADDYQIDRITFEDGTVLDVAAIKEMVQQGTDERDNLYAYDSGSLISAGAGNDYLYGAKGNDTLNGDDGNDYLYGRAGDDVLNGGAGNDNLQGDAGNDTLNGGEGNDSLNAGDGNDMLNGGAGDDSLTGGEGNDTYVFTQGSGKDTIYNYDTSANHQDTVRFEGMRAENVQFTKSGSDLVLTQQDGSSVRISNHFYHANYAVEHFAFDDQTISNPDFAKYVNSANQLIQAMSVFGQSSAVGSEVMNVVQNQNTPNLLVTNA